MALTACDECGKEVSDKAASCPNCGAPLRETVPDSPANSHVKVTRTGAAWEGVGFLLIAVGTVTAIATGSDNHVGGVMIAVGLVVFLVGRFK